MSETVITQDTQEMLPLRLPPLPFVRELADRLESGVSRTVLDVGCHTGRNSLFLAQQGHEVVGIGNEFEEVKGADLMRRELGCTACCNFIVGDARQLPFRRPFDIVIATNVLHLMCKAESGKVLSDIRGLTKQGGVNVVSGYVVEPGTANLRNTKRMFAPGELEAGYLAAGWTIINYVEKMHPIHRTRDGKEHVYSQASIIAQRPW